MCLQDEQYTAHNVNETKCQVGSAATETSTLMLADKPLH